MKLSRRRFLEITAGAGALTLVPWRPALAFYQTPSGLGGIPLFGTAFRGVGPGGIPVAAPDGTAAPVTGLTHYTMDIQQYQDAGVCPTLGPTTMWGYNPANPLGGGVQAQRHLGGIIVAQKGVPLQITFRNKLNVLNHIIPNDLTIDGAGQGVDRMAVHLHGGLTPWVFDGGPHTWFDPRGLHGASFMNNMLNPAAAANEAEYYYSNNQSARFMWYHDHAMGTTRLNAYAGLASAYIIRDAFEINLKNLGLPEFIENSVLGGTVVQELPLVIQEKVFVGPNVLALDPTWTGPITPGSMWYAHTYEKNRWRMAGNAGGGNLKNLVVPDPSCIPEFFGDTNLVNGTSYPQATVEARRYRLRILNATNARFMNLQLYVDDGTPNGITLNPATGVPTNAPFVDAAQRGPALLQIGTEGGFLPHPVIVPTNLPFNPVTMTGSLVMGPAERADVLVDFGAYAGKKIILYSDAPAPFPMGDPRNDYFPGFNVKGNPVNGLTTPGFGPNTRVLMRFNVGPATSADVPLAITTATSLQAGIDPLIVPLGVSTPPPGVPVRTLSLNETFDAYGRLIQMLGTNVPVLKGTLGQPYMNPATETPLAGSTEVWEIYNTTADVHPMHFHLVNFQVINRQPFQVSSFGGGQNLAPNFTGPATPADPNEAGWKETVRMYPGTVTRIIMTFNLEPIRKADGTVVPTPVSLRTGGHEYVWHCHILEHEEHDMMRPMVVI